MKSCLPYSRNTEWCWWGQ